MDDYHYKHYLCQSNIRLLLNALVNRDVFKSYVRILKKRMGL